MKYICKSICRWCGRQGKDAYSVQEYARRLLIKTIVENYFCNEVMVWHALSDSH